MSFDHSQAEYEKWTRADSLALAVDARGRRVLGVGPFRQSTQAPSQGCAFYVNDFALSDQQAWKIPTETHILPDEFPLNEMPIDFQASWEEPNGTEFASVFSEVSEAIKLGKIEKSVPSCAALGHCNAGDPRDLLARVLRLPKTMMPYAWWQSQRGWIGASPELLFTLRGGLLKTMALAGTARCEESTLFAVDEKEIREHEFVAQTLISKLSDIGMVLRRGRDILQLGSLVHFHSEIDVELYREEKIEALIRRLHPTPALGPLPRTTETLEMLQGWRHRLSCPVAFGAPFGVVMDGEFSALVAIRGLHWDQQNLQLPSGCGVIEASRLVNEWRELRLKRESILKLLGIAPKVLFEK